MLQRADMPRHKFSLFWYHAGFLGKLPLLTEVVLALRARVVAGRGRGALCSYFNVLV